MPSILFFLFECVFSSVPYPPRAHLLIFLGRRRRLFMLQDEVLFFFFFSIEFICCIVSREHSEKNFDEIEEILTVNSSEMKKKDV
jgi:hypothetical protein